MVSYINEEAGKETVRLIQEKGGTAEFFYCDASDESRVKALVDQTVSSFGKLGFAHNNAGVNLCQGRIGDADSDAWDKTVKITLYSNFYGMKHQVKAMAKNGGGAMVNTASGTGIEGVPNMPAYVASKFGIVGSTKSVALEYRSEGIRVNAIAPGATLTPAIEGWAKTAPGQFKAVRESMPSGELSTPEDQGNAVLFLCSDLAKQINGVILTVDGGFVAGEMQK